MVLNYLYMVVYANKKEVIVWRVREPVTNCRSSRRGLTYSKSEKSHHFENKRLRWIKRREAKVDEENVLFSTQREQEY